ncbi:glycosyl transferase [Mycolicibacterium aichiense]|uniref:Glycosyl transferase n=1 Tax=Mycolicibacterium aichiense TaxID=1799 RepID=A0AAD1HPF3_9MYCO|nr:glycosyl transferase [Mycolicibacterium aichiense]SUA13758.1 glycosyl transferase [Mycolicibacterium aichiense]
MVSNVSSFGGGGVICFRDALLALREKRPDIDVVAVFPGKGDAVKACAGYGVRAKTAWVPWWGFGKWSRFRIDPHVVIGWLPYNIVLLPGIVQALALLIRERPTVVVTNTMTIPSHAIAAKILGIPHYWMVDEFGRDDHGLWFLYGYARTVRMIGRLSHTAICISQAVEEAVLGIDPTMNTVVFYPAVDTPLGTPPERHPDERMRTVLAGYLSHAKGQRLAIEAVAIARQAGVDIELSLIGTGNQQPFHALAQRLGVEDLVTIHGPTRDLGPYWAAAHVGLMCSQSEAFGRVTVEAMRAGLPVCGTNSGGTPEIIQPYVAGLLSPAGDAHALAANLMKLEADEDLRRRLAYGAAESVRRFERDRHDAEFAAILGLR